MQKIIKIKNQIENDFKKAVEKNLFFNNETGHIYKKIKMTFIGATEAWTVYHTNLDF